MARVDTENNDPWIYLTCPKGNGHYSGHKEPSAQSFAQGRVSFCDSNDGGCSDDCPIKQFVQNQSVEDPFVI